MLIVLTRSWTLRGKGLRRSRRGYHSIYAVRMRLGEVEDGGRLYYVSGLHLA
jgi:hypothetical protein